MLESFTLDSRGVRAVLQSAEVHQMVNTAAEDIRARVRAKLPSGTPVQLRSYTTDRGAASVTIAHARGMGWQARDGVFTRSVAEAGVEFRAWAGQ
ncbi:hypothetical protein [Streptomyces sp. bgisy154]|uniref:hypothetical protein n=1 Tax=Streptomyces sp. bgisy154 TaxID=3413794 RepID=UPI003D70B6C1